MAWRQMDGAWRPVYAPVINAKDWVDRLADSLRALAHLAKPDPVLKRHVRVLSADLKKKSAARKEAEKALRREKVQASWSKAQADAHRRARLEPFDAMIKSAEDALGQAQRDLQRANGLGIAHVGDEIGVDSTTSRQTGRQVLDLWLGAELGGQSTGPVDPWLVAAQWPALGCDTVQVQGRVVPTPFSFSRGSGGQYLLKDFRSCAAHVMPDLLSASLNGQGCATVTADDVTSLNWDPSDQVSHALVWQDPAKRDKATDVSVNAFAYLGLSLVPVVPCSRGLQAVGWYKAGGFVWPIWSSLLGIDAVASLMAAMPLDGTPDMPAWHARGVKELRLASKVNPDGQRNFFAPSRPLY
jgi:hypothetical protein